MYNKEAILNISKQNDSFYLYDQKIIKQNINTLTQNFEGVKFLYSVKANPNPYILDTIFKSGFGADAASSNEVLTCFEKGLLKQDILYSAPGKTPEDIEKTIDKSIIIADSLGEIQRINDVAKSKKIKVKIGVRINPPFSFSGSSAVCSKFGIDIDQFFDNFSELEKFDNIDIVGIHVHSKSQELDAGIIERYYNNMFSLAKSVVEKLKKPLEFINMGSGIGIPYSIKDMPCDTEYLGNAMAKLVAEFKKQYSDTTIYIETGRFLVGKSGVYATKVLDKKVSCGKTFVILANTLNGFIRPSIIQFVSSYAVQEIILPCEPIFTSKDAFQFEALANSNKTETVTLVGNLCTSADVVAPDITLPMLEMGDVVVMTNAGSYAAVLSPKQFSFSNETKEFFLFEDNSYNS